MGLYSGKCMGMARILKMHACVLNKFIVTAKQIIMLCSKFTQLEMKIAHCS